MAAYTQDEINQVLSNAHCYSSIIALNVINDLTFKGYSNYEDYYIDLMDILTCLEDREGYVDITDECFQAVVAWLDSEVGQPICSAVDSSFTNIYNPGVAGTAGTTLNILPLTFLQLLDTPKTYQGQAGLIPMVKSTEDGLFFSPISAVAPDTYFKAGSLLGNGEQATPYYPNASNGLTPGTTGGIQLGGDLTQDTSITGANILTISQALLSGDFATLSADPTQGAAFIGGGNNAGDNGTVTAGKNSVLISYLQGSTGNTQTATFANASGSGIVISDSINAFGMSYAADYSTTAHTNPRWIPDLGYIQSILPTTYTFTNGTKVDPFNPTTVILGGALTQSTTIDITTYPLTITGNDTVSTRYVDVAFSTADILLANQYTQFGTTTTAKLDLNSQSTQIVLGLYYSSGTETTFNFSGGSTLYRDTRNNKPLFYAADYSANYSARSLIDKGYADSHYASASITGTVTSVTSSDNTLATVANSTTTPVITIVAAPKLQTARNIQGISFDGTANINIINGTGFVKASGTTISYDNTTYLPITGGTLTGALTLSGDPISSLQAATMQYVQNTVNNAIAGLQFIDTAVRVASTANVTVSSAPSSIDGVTLSNGDRVLLKNQTTGSENGVYIFNGTGSPLTRATDASTGTQLQNKTIPVTSGSTQADTWWTITNDSITVGTTSLTIVQTAGSGTYANGSGLTLTGNIFALDTTYTDGRYVSLTGSYSNPSWITSLASSKISGSDTTPTSSSTNLVTSGGVYTALQSYLPLTGGTITNTVGPQLTLAYDGSHSFTMSVSSSGTMVTNQNAGWSIQAGGTTRITLQGSSITGMVNLPGAITGTANSSIQAFNGTFSNSDAIAIALGIFNTLNQTSTASTSLLTISPVLTATGSGSQLLLNVGVNSAANFGGTHTAYFTVGTTGLVNISTLTASKVVFTDSSKNLTTTGIGTSSQFIKADGTLDSTVYAPSVVTTLGDIIYGGAAGAYSRLAGNTTTGNYFLTQTGTGSVSAAPTWFNLFGTSNTWTAEQIVQLNGGGTSTTVKGIIAQNTGAAVLGTQQWSPLIGVEGQYWNTTASQSRSIGMYWQLAPNQGTAGTANLYLMTSIDGATPSQSGFQISQGGGVIGGIFNAAAGLSSTGSVGIKTTGTYTNSSGTIYGMGILNTLNQTSTAGDAMLWISPFYSASGTGTHYLIDAGTNSAGSGAGTHSSYFKIDNTGHIFMTESNNKFIGQTTLVSGTKALSITGVTTSSRAIITFVSVGGTVTTTWQYAAVCTSGTLTITALTSAGATNTSDTSIVNYIIFN